MTREVSVVTTTAHDAQSANTQAGAAGPPGGAGESPAEATIGTAAAVLTAAVHAGGLGTSTARAMRTLVRMSISVSRGNGPICSTWGTETLTDCSAKPRQPRRSAPESMPRRVAMANRLALE